MKACECCVKKSQFADKIYVDMTMISEWTKDISVHVRKLGYTIPTDNQKFCIQVLTSKIEDLVNDCVNNGKYKKFLGSCCKKESVQ